MNIFNCVPPEPRRTATLAPNTRTFSEWMPMLSRIFVLGLSLKSLASTFLLIVLPYMHFSSAELSEAAEDVFIKSTFQERAFKLAQLTGPRGATTTIVRQNVPRLKGGQQG